ncbi:ZIP family metal transporter [Tropicimonas sp. TH_r6]|uniref:ZIP family metal transporter n=1 Tax=Tropicimonas sp. TH_r6 TaxID=3082085 RepID=UPI0029529EFC|nr:ZIP family metal transporter [Tropicimonas sp. TH_r6]MDV7143162.1 ZIP family metal transporter [Tropicimonas sp. TH_r6]
MGPDVPLSVLAGLLAATVTTAGILVVRRCGDWGPRNTTYFASFAAGVLISVAFLHIVPRSLALAPDAPIYLLAGYLSVYLLNRLLSTKICDRLGSPAFSIGLIPLLGIGFHSFIDGVVYSIAFRVSDVTGVLTAIGMILHEFPEGVVTYVLLLKGGFRERTAFWLAFAAAAVTTPLGAMSSLAWVGAQTPVELGRLLALSAGALFYVGASHLLPIADREPRKYSFLLVGAGVATAVGIVATKA